MSTLRKVAAVSAATFLLMVGCTSGDDEGDGTTTTTGGSDATEPTATGPSPGVTDDTIKVGITFVDTESLEAVNLNYDLGDHRAVYQALIDDINEQGGIHGRQLELVFAPIDPTQTAPAEAACVKLTEDDDVFIITGFFLNDAVVCPLDAHETAVIGGGMSPERIERAKAPWITWTPDNDFRDSVVREFDELGELDGNVAIFGHVRDQEGIDSAEAVLEDLGIDPVDVGVLDAPDGDTAAEQAGTRTIAERFQAADADTILIIGPSGTAWPTNMADDTSYRPKLLFVDAAATRAFFSNEATTDTSVLDGSLSGGAYGPAQAQFEEAEMQSCIEVLTAAGLDTPAPEDVGDDPSNQPFQAAFQACPDIALLRALLEAAGEDLNYGTLASAIDGLEVSVPGDPTPRTFGPPPAGDGDPQAYIYSWDEEGNDLVLVEE